MKKLIIKTTIIALSIVIALSFLVFGIIAIASPLTIANASFRLGNKDLSVTFTEKHYLKTSSFNDLALLVERGVSAENNEIVIKYAPDFIYSNEFEDYSKTQSGDYTNYIASGYVIALYNKGETAKAISVAFQYVDANFSIPNPVTTLVYTASSKNDVDTLSKISAQLKSLNSNDNIKNVISVIESLI